MRHALIYMNNIINEAGDSRSLLLLPVRVVHVDVHTSRIFLLVHVHDATRHVWTWNDLKNAPRRAALTSRQTTDRTHRTLHAVRHVWLSAAITMTHVDV